ncbi:MAG: methyltransferase domain-containing protein [Acidobacteriia bacterium]|nr:methyltransferase domain-containing protein [Terriglobia bacterium]
MPNANTPSEKSETKPAPSAWNANLYDAKHDFVWKYGSDVVSLLAPQPGERILDLGCGTGHLSAQIAESGARVLGVDRSPEMIQAARQAYPKLKFEVADAMELKFDGEFDAVFSNAVLHWIHEPVRVILGVRRALAPGGRFVAEFGGRGNIAKMVRAFDQALAHVNSPNAGKINPWYYPSVSEYAALLEQNGFEVRFITLFDRPTGLADGAAGLRNWIAMFGSAYLEGLDAAQRENFLRRVEDFLRPDLFREEQWWADYRRLRLVAFV